MDVIVAELKRCSSTHFDPEVVEAFWKIQAFSVGAYGDTPLRGSEEREDKFKMAAS